MREVIPTNKKPGDTLSAKHVNMLSRIAGRVPFSGTGASGISATFDGHLVNEKGAHEIVVISSQTTNGIYAVRLRYYSHNDNEWKTNEETNFYELDASETGGGYIEGDKVAAFWHPQRQAFIPVARSSVILRVGKTKGTIKAGQSGTVIVWQDGFETNLELEGVFYDHVDGSGDLPDDLEVVIGWFPEEGEGGIWRIIGADCGPSSG